MIMSVAEAHAALTAPGAPFEIGEIEIRGIRTRIWKNTPVSLRAVFAQTRAHGDLTYLVYEGDRWSYARHYRAVVALAHALIERYGIAKGERVAIAMRNYPEWAVAFWATTTVGAIAVPLNAWWTGAELEYGLADSGSVLAFADAERAARLAGRLAGLDLRALVVARPDRELPPGAVEFAELASAETGAREPPAVVLTPDDDATIFYTSGTTGKPKGALGTHRNICTNLVSLAFGQARALLRRGEKLPDADAPVAKKSILLSVPFFHATGCHTTLVPAAMAGHKLVTMRRWDTDRALALIEAERITHFGGVPAVAWQVMESPNAANFDLSSVESVGYGGAPAAPELVARIGEWLPGAMPGQGYGLTETSSVTTQNLAEDYRRKPASVGPAAPVSELRVVDRGGRDVEPGAVGELWIKGANVVKGYWNKPEATALTFTDGWLHTGDLAKLDDEGFLYIVDRVKDMLIRGGENVYCVEVEDALYSHPAVIDAAVVGLPHRILGEEVGAAVQIKSGMTVSEDALKRHVADRLAQFKVPVRIDLRDRPLPRNANGKILKPTVRDEMLAARPVSD